MINILGHISYVSVWEIFQAGELLEHGLCVSLSSLTPSCCSPCWFYQLPLAAFERYCFSTPSVSLVLLFLFDEYKMVLSKFAFLWLILSEIKHLFLYFFNLFLFMAVLGLRFCVRAFSSCGKRGPLFIAVRAGLSLSRPLLLRSTGSRRAGSVIVAHGPSCSAACGIFPYQGSNPCPLHWQADSQPLRHQGSPCSGAS